MTEHEAKTHFLEFGIKSGRRIHAGRRILKIALMTKNEYPLIESWVLYHGNIFGFKNLYIFDVSTEEKAMLYLANAAYSLGINVYFSTNNLWQQIDSIASTLRSLRESCDFVIKMDTDEFVAVFNDETKEISIDKETILSQFDNLPYDGSKYRNGFELINLLEDINCTWTDASSKANYFDVEHTPKSFFPSWTFKTVDLGGHFGEVVAPFNNSFSHLTNLSFLHYHWPCYNHYLTLCRSVAVGHHYLNGNENPADEFTKLVELSKDFPQVCAHQNSCHKNYELYLSYKDPIQHRATYWKRSGVNNKKAIHFNSMIERLAMLRLEYQLAYKPPSEIFNGRLVVVFGLQKFNRPSYYIIKNSTSYGFSSWDHFLSYKFPVESSIHLLKSVFETIPQGGIYQP